MSYFTIIHNGTVHFNRNLTKPNGLPYEVPIEALASPWGFMIPMCYDCFSVFDYFEGSKAKLDTFALLIGRNGDVYEYAFDAKIGGMARRRIPIGKDSLYIRTNILDHECLLTGMLAGGMSVKEALVMTSKEHSGFNINGHHSMSMTKILQTLEIRKAEPFPPLYPY